MYGLPQAGRVASNVLIPRLEEAGYRPTGRTPGLFKHDTNSVFFLLIVDDFFVSHENQQHFQHLQDTLRKHYQITVDDNASKFCGMALEWNYEEGYMFPCQDTLKKHCNASHILHPPGHSMPRANGQPRNTEHPFNTRTMRTIPHPYPKRASQDSSK